MSTDLVFAHRAFAQALRLPYPLVADPGASIARAYGVSVAGGWWPSRRVTFVIDRHGTVARVIEGEVDIAHHVDAALATLRELANRL